MTSDKRFASFFSRVDFEREVLQLVNQTSSHTATLHGLAPAARARWLNEIPEPARNAELVILLTECWDILGGLADHSRNVFETKPANQERRVALLREISAVCLPA